LTTTGIRTGLQTNPLPDITGKYINVVVTIGTNSSGVLAGLVSPPPAGSPGHTPGSLCSSMPPAKTVAGISIELIINKINPVLNIDSTSIEILILAYGPINQTQTDF